MGDPHLPDDLRAALALFRNASAGFAALPEPARRAALEWVAAAPDSTTRHARIIEIVVASNEGHAAWFDARRDAASGHDG